MTKAKGVDDGLQPELVFTAESVRELLNLHVFRSRGSLNTLRMHMPRQTVLQNFAEKLNFICFEFRLANESRTIDIPLAYKFRTAVKDLEEILPAFIISQTRTLTGLRESMKKVEDIVWPPKLPEDSAAVIAVKKANATIRNAIRRVKFDQAIEQLERLRLVLKLTRKYEILFSGPDPRQRKPWNWRSIAPNVGKALRGMLQDGNRNQRIGISEGGPVSRFVTAVIPKITGEHPSETNVCKCLKDAERDRVGTKTKPSVPG
jgi:hypothetical protein